MEQEWPKQSWCWTLCALPGRRKAENAELDLLKWCFPIADNFPLAVKRDKINCPSKGQALTYSDALPKESKDPACLRCR